MSYTLDVNVLLYASDASSAFHVPARDFLVASAAGPELLYLFWPTIMGYLRIATHHAIFDTPLSDREARRNIEGMLHRSHVRTPGEDEGFWEAYGSVSDELVVRGNLVPDGHIVALMRRYEVPTIWTHDRDFRKFRNIAVKDPFADD